MKKVLFILLFIYSTSAFSLKIQGVKNAKLKKIYLYEGSRQWIAPENGVIVSVRGKANKKVRLKIKEDGPIYLTQGARIEDLKAIKPIILLDNYGEGRFEIGFSLIGEKKVSGKHKKQIKYKIEYIN